MRDERPETIDDIVADIRAQNQGLPEDSYALSPLVCDLLSISARIEAAHKRELEATRENSSQVGNAEKMREALEKVRFYLPHFLQYMRLHLEDAEAGGYYERILEVVNAALSAPPRNCDVLEGSTADDEFEKAMGFPPSKTADERDAIMRENWFLFKHWLFAESKGEVK